MNVPSIEGELRKRLLKEQRNEITAHIVYSRLAEKVKDPHNADILRRIAKDERNHHDFLKDLTKEEVAAYGLSLAWYTLLSKVLGLTFLIKLLEGGEEEAQKVYKSLEDNVPGVRAIQQDEEQHERQLIGMINEERLEYIGSVVLGLSDALVELTGTLAGLSFAFQNNRLVALSGLITGIAASMSMAASEYLSKKTSGGTNAVRAALYTGTAYILTVALLVLPFMLFDIYMISLPFALGIAVVIILFFNYYISVAKDMNFRRQFGEMAGLSLGVAALSFLVGVLVRTFLGVDV
jgi:VIT1/CCC1 family predicted Fe2+/Mn2+ transporter